MQRTHIVAALALVLSVPAAFAGRDVILPGAQDGICFSAGATAYRLTRKASPADYTIRFDNFATRPDLIVEIAEGPTAADFVLLSDGTNDTGCDGASAIRTIRLDPKAAEPDLVIALRDDRTEGAARIYAQAPFKPEDAAALFAVLRRAPKNRIASAAR